MESLLTPITIKQLVKRKHFYATAYKDKLIIADKLSLSELFKYPCRLDAVSILICTDGKMECTINLKKYTVEKNMIVICRNCDILQILSCENLEVYAGVVSIDFINELKINFWQQNYRLAPRSTVTKITDTDKELLKHYYPLLYSNILSGSKETENIIKNLIQAFVYNIISIINISNVSVIDSTASRNEVLFDKFMNLLSQFHTKERSVRFYASEMCLTPNYLSGAVKDFSGKAALDWINEYVILEAKTLLKYSELSVQEISYKLNFPTQSAFGKYFKRLVGIGPKDFRG